MKNVLVVEDEKPLSEAIKLKLEKSDFAVVTARSMEQAVKYLEDEVKIDVIWLDHYLLGRGSGLDLVAKVKEPGSPWQKIPIFVVSNTASPDKVNSYLRLGVNKYYTKTDYRLDQIIGDIQDLLEKGTIE
ncbi:MAG TPA: response regulator [bacterium]|nr:response regulator [bacterium]HPT30009.1 response regulator [bacterium]